MLYPSTDSAYQQSYHYDQENFNSLQVEYQCTQFQFRIETSRKNLFGLKQKFIVILITHQLTNTFRKVTHYPQVDQFLQNAKYWVGQLYEKGHILLYSISDYYQHQDSSLRFSIMVLTLNQLSYKFFSHISGQKSLHVVLSTHHPYNLNYQ